MNREKVAEYIGDIDDRYLEEVFEHKEQSRRIIMTENRKRRSIVKILAIAATVVLILATTVSAVALTGLISKDEAFSSAYNHLHNTSDPEEKDTIANLILSGMIIEESAELSEAQLGFKEGRFVYNLSFRLIDYMYYYTVDAKTGVVLDCYKEYDPKEEEPDENLTRYDHEELWSYAELTAPYGRVSALNIATDYFGTHPMITNGRVDSYVDAYEDGHYEIMFAGGGYVYTCKVDMQTGELYDDEITEDPEFTGDKFRLEHIDGVIGLNEASRIAFEDSGLKMHEKLFVSAYYNPVLIEVNDGHIVNISGYGFGIYEVHITDADNHDIPAPNYYIKADTGDILKVVDGRRMYQMLNNDDGKQAYRNAEFAAIDYYGLYTNMMHQGVIYGRREVGINGEIIITKTADGYVYQVTVDRGTFEVLDAMYWEDPNNDGERVLHKAVEGIGLGKAFEIAVEAAGVDDVNTVDFISTLYLDYEYDDGLPAIFKVHFQQDHDNGKSGRTFSAVDVDALTGEVLSVSQSFYGPDGEPNQIPSTEAPEGMISEAEAQVVVLDDLGITDRDVRGFTIELKESEKPNERPHVYYEINFTDLNGACYIYKVDAVSGQISGKGVR